MHNNQNVLGRKPAILLVGVITLLLALYFYVGNYGLNMVTLGGKGEVKVAYVGTADTKVNGEDRRYYSFKADVVRSVVGVDMFTSIEKLTLTKPNGEYETIGHSLLIKQGWFSGGNGITTPNVLLAKPKNQLDISEVFFKEKGVYKLSFPESIYTISPVVFTVN